MPELSDLIFDILNDNADKYMTVDEIIYNVKYNDDYDYEYNDKKNSSTDDIIKTCKKMESLFEDVYIFYVYDSKKIRLVLIFSENNSLVKNYKNKLYDKLVDSDYDKNLVMNRIMGRNILTLDEVDTLINRFHNSGNNDLELFFCKKKIELLEKKINEMTKSNKPRLSGFSFGFPSRHNLLNITNLMFSTISILSLSTCILSQQ